MSGTIQGGASINNGPEVPATLTIDTEMIDVTMSTKTEPDMRWEYVDPFDHFHAYDKDGKLPTLVTRTEYRDCNGCGDEECEGYDVTVYDCAICGAPVEPATITTAPVDREYRPGRTSWTVEVEQHITEERVSVVLTAGGRTLFGIAAASGNYRAEGGPAGMRVWTKLYGVSPLGQRKARARAAA